MRACDWPLAREVGASFVECLGNLLVLTLCAILGRAKIAMEAASSIPSINFEYRTMASTLEVVRVSNNIDIKPLSDIGPLVSHWLCRF